mmetsp:Transcript_45533/g.52636  ORF Transcript_45533/g.52636 Transcript_45533/m.52636 type:complete len:360 (+) Transcript_45533:53-1132(+)
MEKQANVLDLTDPNREFIRGYLSDAEFEELIVGAKEAAKMSYSVYSKFSVGCCLLTQCGEYFRGSNFENLNFSCTQHAEATAFAGALNKGHKDFKAIAVYATAENYSSIITSCGECRQYMSEYCVFLPIIKIHSTTGAVMIEFLHEILPIVPIIFGDSFHAKRKLNKYETAIRNCNAWVLNDTCVATRNEMKKLISDRNFDEINERETSSLAKRVTDDHKLEAPFGAGHDRLNMTTVNILMTSIAKKISSKQLSHQSVKVHSTNDNLSELLRDVAIAVFKTHNVCVGPAADSQEKSDNQLVVDIKCNGDSKSPMVTVEFCDQKGDKVKYSALADAEDARKSTEIFEHFDFRNYKLKCRV